MTDTVAAIAAQHIESKPGHRLVPARFGKPGQQADVWVECPAWCKDDHVKDWNHHAVDLDHWGPVDAGWDTDCITRQGDRMLSLDARLHSDPAATDPRLSAAHVLMDDEAVQVYLTPEMAEKTADELIAFAAQIRHLAREAREFNAKASRPRRNQADEALRRVRAGKWQALSRDDIATLPTAHLLKAFGVSVTEADGDGTELLGEPGAMELRVGRDVGQQLRDSEARRLLAEYAAGASRD
ncbi:MULTISPECIES: DUF6907 domain-containing protein [unclassified Streptomyces]|uniref:DUF6907 domain-containing protein n=1 Tax=unclassified Streptomyces TaxID=2593676 RepID=UPI001163DE1A|nr:MULTISPECIES: hypothetical protein [unclassified Streptomyces]NMI57130.1 hypothetical protein [Streptomyces sp. RLA2-12]QDN56504.1 hypothetical protein FNV67_15420 [Streptomyces sp. S1D4-20]QDN66681.1 hypothetical protein FNV66_15015 [Streptomyces sp. S1D4-14]QDO49088.1 hypothetical protein FNV60_13265 [Streptomyces sp. RLB3-5]QDO59329.1 hypothetical protein FNV59_15510 [Streptomyces sp. RLB1-8]